jgi:hypothetical protein
MVKKPTKDEPSGEEVIGTGNDARVARLNAIGDAVDRGRADELADVNDDETTTAFIAPELTEEEAGRREAAIRPDPDGTVAAELARAEAEANQDAGEAPPEGEVSPAAVAEPPPKIKVKLNGQEVELTQEELIARASEADAAKAEAKRLKDEAAAAAKPAAAPAGPSQPSAEDRAAAEAAELEERRALARAIQMGTEEEAMAALERVAERGARRTTADAEATARLVDERMSFKEAATWFSTEYADIVDDQTLRDLALKRDQELVASGDRRPYRERYREIGDGLRDWVKGLTRPADGAAPVDAPKPAAPAAATRVDRKAAAAAHAAPAASSVRAPKATGADEEKEETTQETIAKMAQARGGPQWLRG